jgi:hypothetical protein
MSGIVKWKPISVEQALAVLRAGGLLHTRREVVSRKSPITSAVTVRTSAAVRRTRPRRLDAIRQCAVHGLPWAAVYLLENDDSYCYSGSIQITKTLYRTQYAPGTQQTLILDDKWIDEETCAQCGAAGRGVFECGRCKNLVCHGLSSGVYFRCFCGAEGWSEARPQRHVAIIPGVWR